MNNLMAVATFPNIPAENLPRFKEVASEMLKSIMDQKSILRYEIFFNAEGTKCVVLEEYETPAGVIEHVERHKQYLSVLSELGGKIEGSMFPLSDQGEEIHNIKTNWDSRMHIHFASKR